MTKTRNVFIEPIIGQITQGTIFNGAITEDYTQNEVHGIIITPRCDISNGKVNVYHYLPIIKFSEWTKNDFWLIFSYQVKGILISKITSIFNKYNISSTILDKFSPSLIKGKLTKKITREQDKKKFLTAMNDYEALGKSATNVVAEDLFDHNISVYEKVAKTIFKELKDHKRKGYYLLESWENDSSDYYIVLMREIKTITVKVGELLGNGFYLSQLTEKELIKNDLKIQTQIDDMVYPVTTLASPYIEHLMQVFFQNFGRIGINDHQKNIESQLLDLCKK